MKQYFLISFIIFVHACATKNVKIVAGEKFDSANNIAINEWLKDTTEHTAIVSGKIVEVCQHKGCWIVLEDTISKEKVFMAFKDEAFNVPKQVVNKNAVLKVQKIENTDEDYAASAEATGIVVN